MPTTAFVSYCHADERALERLHKHMAVLKREGTLPTWTDHAIVPGDRLNAVISAQLDRSQVFLALVSPDYLASGYCYEREFARAQELATAGRMRIVPIILEPCDWLSSPFKDYAALPQDGQPISGFTNPNVAYLNVVSGLRRIVDVTGILSATPSATPASGVAKRLRIKQDFDSIQRGDYADRAFAVIRDYFRSSCAEMAQIGDDLRAKFEDMDGTAFTCSVVNRAKLRGGEAHITIHNTKSRNHGLGGDISYVNQRHASRNTSNGSIHVDNDDYQMFLTMDRYDPSSGRKEKVSPEQAAERLWNDFVKQAGIEYE